jgi:mannose-1-phosphate guanylyltransferase
MRAVLLAAGLGTRLRPLTDHTPKCLIEVAGRTLLDRWLDALADLGIDDVLVNTHHLHAQVEEHLALRNGGPDVTTSHESVLLGSAGTLHAAAQWLSASEAFLAINADNLSDFDLRLLVEEHERRPCAATIAVFRSPEPTRCGIVEVDADGTIAGFEEKPKHPRSNLANAGIYLFDRQVLSHLTDRTPLDIGHDLLPRLVGASRALDIGSSYLADVGTPDSLAAARAHWNDREAEGVLRP